MSSSPLPSRPYFTAASIQIDMAAFANLWTALSMWPIAFLVLTFVYLVVTRFRTYWRLKAYRGPFFAQFSELWVFRRTLAGDLHEKSLTVIEKYGGAESIARVGPNLLMTSNTAFVKALNDDRAWKKGSWYPGMALDPGHDSVFSTTDDVVHDRLKAQLSRGVRQSQQHQGDDKLTAQ